MSKPANGQHRIRSRPSFIRACAKLGVDYHGDDRYIYAKKDFVIIGEYNSDERCGWIYAPSHSTKELIEVTS